MAFYRKSGGSNVTPTAVKRRSGGSWTNVQTIKRRSGGTWVTVWTAYTPISVSASGGTGTGNGLGTSAPSSMTVTAYVSVSASGGSGTKTYSVSKVSGSTIAFTGGNTSSPNFSATLNRNQTVSGVYRFTVSDGISSDYADVTVTLKYVWIDG